MLILLKPSQLCIITAEQSWWAAPHLASESEHRLKLLPIGLAISSSLAVAGMEFSSNILKWVFVYLGFRRRLFGTAIANGYRDTFDKIKESRSEV